MSVIRFHKSKNRFMFDNCKAGQRLQKFFRTEDEANDFKKRYDARVPELETKVKAAGDDTAIVDAIKEYQAVAGIKKSVTSRSCDRVFLQKFYDWTHANSIHYMDELTLRLVEMYQVHLMRTMKPASVNREFSTLNHFFGKAKRWGYTSVDLSDAVLSVPIPPSSSKAWTNEDLQKFNEAVPKWIADILLAMDLTGTRPGQLASMKFQDVDFERRCFTTSSKKGGVWRTTSKPAPSDFFELVKTNQADQRRRFLGAKADFVFLNSKGRPFTTNSVGIALRKIRGEIGLEHLTLYGMRHKFGTDLADMDVNQKKISVLMDHSRSSTSDRYTSPRDASIRDVITARDNVRKLEKVT